MSVIEHSFAREFEVRKWALGNALPSFVLEQVPVVLDELITTSATDTITPSAYISAMAKQGFTHEAAIDAIEEHIGLGSVSLTSEYGLAHPRSST